MFTFTFSPKSILTKCWNKLELRSTDIDEREQENEGKGWKRSLVYEFPA